MNIFDFIYYCIVVPIFRIVFFCFYKVEIKGKKNLPPQGGFIVASIHRSFLDGPFITSSLRPTHIYWVVSKRIYKKWYFRPLCTVARCVPVNGSTGFVSKLLREKRRIGIFPQGGVKYDDVIKKGHKGVAVIALSTGAPVVPCYIDGTFDISKKIVFAPRVFRPLKLVIGKPLHFKKQPPGRIPNTILNDAVSRVIEAINDLKPA